MTTELTVFKYIVGPLSPVYVMELRDILLQPPTNNPYMILKITLIKAKAQDSL